MCHTSNILRTPPTLYMYLHNNYLDNRVVNIDGWHWQVLLLGELVEAVDPRDALFHDAPYVLGHVATPLGSSQQPVGGVSTVVKNEVGLPAVCEETLVDAPPEVVLRLTAPGKDRQTWRE